MIFIILIVYQGSTTLQRWRATAWLKTNQVAMLIGMIVGMVAVSAYSRESIEEVRQSQAFLFKVFLLPPILFEQ
jgi:hypothetical protein